MMTFSINLSSLNGSNGFRLDGEAAGDYSGRSVSNAGDVNGDGFDDVIIGASGTDPNGSSSGSSYVVFGQASGFSAAMNLSILNGSNGFRLDGEA
ncbi:MAG: integrin alpha, partial [Candidatus Nitrotoga sp.]